jgi:stage IV sporulation protein FB
MLLEPGASPYDLNFRLFGTPVRVSPWFWLVSAIFGWDFARDLGLPYLGLWIACAFFSILLHEFGHIWAGKAFGSDGTIVLYSFGGLAIGSNDLRQRWQRIVVSLAGPGIQLVLYGALELAKYRMGDGFKTLPPVLRLTLGMLMWINLFWPLFNLVPVWPLDGGMVSREVCTGISRSNGLQVSLRISFAVALFLAVHAVAAEYGSFRIPYLPTGVFPAAIFFAALAYESYLLFKQSSYLHYEPPDDRLPWE